MPTASPARTVPTALFGVGRAGSIHLRNLLAHPVLRLTHVVDVVRPPNLPANVTFVSAADCEAVDLQQGDAVEAIVIATPTALHPEHVLRCLGAGKHVFVEKPVADTLWAIQACFDAAETARRTLFVGYTRRFDPTIRAIHDDVAAGKLGEVRYAHTISRDFPVPTTAFLRHCGGLFHDCATHDIDYVNWVLNDVPTGVHVTATGGDATGDATERHNHAHAVIQLSYASGTHAVLQLSRYANSYDQRCEFYGDRDERINAVYDPRARMSFPERYAVAFRAELDAFAACVCDRTPAPVTRQDCVVNYLVAEACQRSVETGGRVTVRYGGDDTFREYGIVSAAVRRHYEHARTRQTVAFVQRMHREFAALSTPMHLWDILVELNTLVDVSDPDCAHPNLYHALQTAEAIRRDGHPRWMQLTGLLHDAGKIMYRRGCDADGTSKREQWAMVGDTFVVGCALPQTLVFPQYNANNPDSTDPRYNTTNGMYTPGCGLDALLCSWGHDEYLYRILTDPANPNTLPPVARHIVRYHSLYAYHEKGEYMQFQSESDKRHWKALKLFNTYDLYTKTDVVVNTETCAPYYRALIEEFFAETAGVVRV